MTHIVTEACIKCKYTDCVEVCPVDCFYEDDDMLAINPEECIDCGVCIPECPIDAIKAEPENHDEDEEMNFIKWVEINQKISNKGNNITQIKNPLPNAEFHKDEIGKYEKYLKDDVDPKPRCAGILGRGPGKERDK